MISKAALRQSVRARLEAMSVAEREKRSASIRERILAHPLWMGANTVALFAAQPMEPDLDPLVTGGKRFCYPRVHGKNLEFIAVPDPAELVAGCWGLREPAGKNRVALAEIDLLLVPGLAFSPELARLGRGGGYYDRVIAAPELRAHKIGICFGVQIAPELPVEAHDREVDELISA